MPMVDIDGIATRYEIVGPQLGAGPPLLMYAPGGFNATIEAWSTLGIYAKIKLLEHLPQKFTCIVFDRRECGQSGGRVEPITWLHFVAQGKGLLDHLGIARAHLIGGCMGCGPVAAFGVAHPHMVASMILFWPVGGYKYRRSSHKRFADHLGFVREQGLKAVVDLVQREGKPFGADPRGGPWASVIKHDTGFASAYAAQDAERYIRICEAMRDALFDRDTAPGARPEDLVNTEIPALIVPGHDDSHATSAARYLDECLPLSEYWDMPVERQTEAATSALVLEFLEKQTA
jgi:pimeloyl-ACP methyl ester carboxylesterase